MPAGGASIICLYIALVIACLYGYVMNIVAIFQTLSDPISGLFIARCVGVIAAPLGALLGIFA